MAGTFTATATGFPAPTFSISAGSLPPGVSLDGATGVLSGTPSAGSAGAYAFSFTATNYTATTQPFVLTVTVSFSLAGR